MQRVTLAQLPVSEATRKTLKSNPDIAGALIPGDPDAVHVTVFGPRLRLASLAEALKVEPDAAWLWERDWKPTPAPRDDGLTRTAAALKLIDEDDLTPYAAAKMAGIDTSAVYRALARREAKAKAPRCQCCGRPLAAVQEAAA